MALSYEDVLRRYESEAARAREAAEKRYAEIMRIFDEIIKRYQPGGAFQERTERELAQRKAREVGQETQQLISSGLYGASTLAGVGRRWEQAVGTPQRLALEDIMERRVGEAMLGKAAAITQREDIPPSASLYAALLQRATAIPGTINVPSYSSYGSTSFGSTGWSGRRRFLG